MDDSMMLHHNKKVFTNFIKEVSDNLRIRDVFIEKDYWITLVLKRLYESQYVNRVVFKGGTSLSKGFRLINRFSEDIDLAVINTSEMSGNQLKKLIRNLEKVIAKDLEEIEIKGITSKGSRFRKSIYHYPMNQDIKTQQVITDKLIIEVNSFSNPYPYVMVPIQSMIAEFLQLKGSDDLINKYNLESFELQILDKKQTLNEKVVSLIRFSFDKNPTNSISGKIRHFYDLHYLINDEDCEGYIESHKFKEDIIELIRHDRETFDEPVGWNEKAISQSPLIKDFDNLWGKLKNTYNKELSTLTFIPIPKENIIAATFKRIINAIDNIKV